MRTEEDLITDLASLGCPLWTEEAHEEELATHTDFSLTQAERDAKLQAEYAYHWRCVFLWQVSMLAETLSPSERLLSALTGNLQGLSWIHAVVVLTPERLVAIANKPFGPYEGAVLSLAWQDVKRIEIMTEKDRLLILAPGHPMLVRCGPLWFHCPRDYVRQERLRSFGEQAEVLAREH